MANNREISQFAGLVTVNDTTNQVSIASTLEISGGGKLGIGTDNPSYKLQVETTDSAALGRFKRNDPGTALFQILSQDGGNITLGLGDVSDPDIQYIKSDNSNNSLSFGSNTFERLRINSSGDVGINDDSPTQSESGNDPVLSFKGRGSSYAGRIDFKDSSGNLDAIVRSDNGSLLLGADPSNVTGNSVITFSTDGGERARVTSGGDLLIGGTLPSSPNITLNTNGQISASNTINATNNYNNLAKARIYQDGDSTGTGEVTVSGLSALAGAVYRGGFIKISLATAKRGSPGNEDQWAEFFITYLGLTSYSTTSITRTAGDTSVTCTYSASTSNSVTFSISYTRTASHWLCGEVEIVDRNTPGCTATITSAF